MVCVFSISLFPVVCSFLRFSLGVFVLFFPLVVAIWFDLVSGYRRASLLWNGLFIIMPLVFFLVLGGWGEMGKRIAIFLSLLFYSCCMGTCGVCVSAH